MGIFRKLPRVTSHELFLRNWWYIKVNVFTWALTISSLVMLMRLWSSLVWKGCDSRQVTYFHTCLLSRAILDGGTPADRVQYCFILHKLCKLQLFSEMLHEHGQKCEKFSIWMYIYESWIKTQMCSAMVTVTPSISYSTLVKFISLVDDLNMYVFSPVLGCYKHHNTSSFAWFLSATKIAG